MISYVLKYLSDKEKITEATIQNAVKLFLPIVPLNDSEQTEVIKELQARLQIDIDRGVYITAKDHKPWYAEAKVNIDPRFWERYVQEEGSMFSDRDDFADALDFIAWYMQKTQQINHIPYGDAYRQYLNYHEGWQGYAQGSYQNKDWLIRTAQAVQARSDKYRAQLIKCDLY